MTDLAITTDQITGIGIGTIAAVVVIGLVVALIITKLVARVITAVIVVALGVLIWTQRTAVVDAAQDAAQRCSATYFGVHIDPTNPKIREACKDVSKH